MSNWFKIRIAIYQLIWSVESTLKIIITTNRVPCILLGHHRPSFPVQDTGRASPFLVISTWTLYDRQPVQGEYAVGHIPRESSRVAWYFLRDGGEITCEITGRRKGRMLMVRFWRFHAFTLPWESQEATTCEGDYKQLESIVCHSTGIFQSHNSHKRVLKMPLEVAVVSIS